MNPHTVPHTAPHTATQTAPEPAALEPAAPEEGAPLVATPDAAAVLASLQEADLSQWAFSLWLLKRRLVRREAHYSALLVDTDAKLRDTFVAAVGARLQGRQAALAPYDFLSEDQDDRWLTLAAAETDFPKVQAQIGQGFDNRRARVYEDLLDGWAFVVLLQHRGRLLHAVRRISRYTRAAKLAASGLVHQLLFRDEKLIDLEAHKVLTLDTEFDFLACDGILYIADKTEFERTMNFREGMERHRDAVLQDLERRQLLDSVAPLRKVVGASLPLLRKMAAIHQSGYYRDPAYLAALIKKNDEHQWGLKIAQGRIVAREDQVELLLKLLNNDRLASVINREVFDAAAKRKVR